MRAFIGIDFETEFKNKMDELQQRLRKYAIHGRWKHFDNFHLTLKFLEDINFTQQRQIDSSMEKLCASVKPFRLTITEMGIFDGRDSIRVLWLGLAGDTQELDLLHEGIDNTFALLGFPPEKRNYKPHITIGQDIAFECGFDQIRDIIGELQFGPISVNSLFLFRSEQVENRRIYSKVSRYDFKKSGDVS